MYLQVHANTCIYSRRYLQAIYYCIQLSDLIDLRKCSPGHILYVAVEIVVRSVAITKE